MCTYEQAAKKLANLQPFIQYLQDTEESEWAVDVVRTKDGKNCLSGHLIDWFYGKEYEGNINAAWDMFEEMWMTTYVIYDVNDGKNPKYRQPTPKQRVLAYMKNLWLGLEEGTQTGMANEAARHKKE